MRTCQKCTFTEANKPDFLTKSILLKKLYIIIFGVLPFFLNFQNTQAQSIRSVAKNKNLSVKYSLYPNPSVSGVNIRFAENTGGSYEVKLVNTTGQKIFEKKYALNRDGFINIEWPQKPVPGIYYLKVKDLDTGVEEIARLEVM